MRLARALCWTGSVLLVGLAACRQDSAPTSPSETPSDENLYYSTSGKQLRAQNAANHVVEFSGTVAQLTQAVSAVGGRVDRAKAEAGVAKVSGLTDATAAQLRTRQGIVAVNRDLVIKWIPSLGELKTKTVSAKPGPNSPANPGGAFFIADQWNLRQIKADQAWATGFRGQGTKIAILDTGIDDTHLDMIGKVDRALSVAFTPNQNPNPAFPVWGDDNFHGTHVGSIVSSNNFGTASVAPNAKLIAVKVLDVNGEGTFADVIGGIIYAADVGANVINMSLGAYFPKNHGGGQLAAAVSKAIKYANSKGVLVVASAGNDAANLDKDGSLVVVPGESANLAVSATGPTDQQDFDQLAVYSNFGRKVVDVAAPGGNILGTSDESFLDFVEGPCSRQSLIIPDCAGPDFIFWVFVAGTSQAAPHVSGVAALIDGKSSLDASGLAAKVERTADDLGPAGLDPAYGHGRINALRAVTE